MLEHLSCVKYSPHIFYLHCTDGLLQAALQVPSRPAAFSFILEDQVSNSEVFISTTTIHNNLASHAAVRHPRTAGIEASESGFLHVYRLEGGLGGDMGLGPRGP